MAIDENKLSAEEEVIVGRVVELVAEAAAEPLSEDERQALRAFLQRGETRLSTYQRVAGVFLNGAGLLVLLPGLARESISIFRRTSFNRTRSESPGSHSPG